MRRLALLAALWLSFGTALAIDTGPAFEDPVQQERYEVLIQELRCLMCQNQNIADSNAMIASDLRREVRELMQAGKTDAEIRVYMTDRYGDFVLYRPPFTARTWLLWAAPGLLVIGGLAAAIVVVIRRSRAARLNPAALDEDADPS